MLFTREELVEMGLLSPELPSNPRQLNTELPSNPRQFEQVATSGLPRCQKVASANQQVATDLTPLFIYIYFFRLLGCKNIYTLVEINVNSKDETQVLPCNPSNQSLAEYLVSLWNTYDLQRFLEVATGCQPLATDNLEMAIEATNTCNLGELIRADYRFYKRHGHPPGDAWDGIITDDGLDLNQFNTHEARVISDGEVLESAMVERQRVRPGRTMLSLMYEHNVQDYTWFEGHDGQWHCFNHTGLT